MRFKLLLAMVLLPAFTACTSTGSKPAGDDELVGPMAGTWKNRSGDTTVIISPTARGGFTIESTTMYVHMDKNGYETKLAPLALPGDPPVDWLPGDKRDWSQLLSTYARYLQDTERTLSATREVLQSFDQPEVKALIPPLLAMEKALSSNQKAKVTAASRQLARTINPPKPHTAGTSRRKEVVNDLSPELSDFDDDGALPAH